MTNHLQELIAEFADLVESAKYLAEYQKALYEEYLVAGFTEDQALKLTMASMGVKA